MIAVMSAHEHKKQEWLLTQQRELVTDQLCIPDDWTSTRPSQQTYDRKTFLRRMNILGFLLLAVVCVELCAGQSPDVPCVTDLQPDPK